MEPFWPFCVSVKGTWSEADAGRGAAFPYKIWCEDFAAT
jgi:hypothetical protein